MRFIGHDGTSTSIRPGRMLVSLITALAAISLIVVPGTSAVAAERAGGAPAARTSPAASGAGPLTEQQAQVRARASGKPVQVTGATTPSSTLTANPNGTFTLTQTDVPVRKHVAGQWVNLDATLHRNADGSISPTATTSALRLSGGGSGPLAVMTDDGASLALAFPGALTGPTLSGATATYPDVLPGVDLQVTADDQGGFSDVLVVKDASAAANPALRDLAFGTRTTGGITLRSDAAGNLAATTKGGHVLFSASAPRMWDSATAPASTPAATDPRTGQHVDKRSGTPLASSASGPGEAARGGRVGVHVTGATLTLSPDMSLLSGTNVRYPVYIDPTYAAGSTEQAYTMVNSAFPTTSYWNSGTSGLLQVGDNAWQAPFFTARSFVRESVPSTLYTATVYSSTVYFTDEWAPSCSGTEADLYWTGAISSSTSWNNQPSWNTLETSKSFADGYDSSCPAASVGFDITALMKQAASGKWSNMTLGLRAANESDPYGWKQFNHVVTMSTTYDHAPNTPTTLTTSPPSSCTAATPTTVGNGDMFLYAAVSDPDGGSLQVTFNATNTSTGAVLKSATEAAASGTPAPLLIPQATLDAAAGGKVTEFSWNVKVSDGTLSSGTSVTCHFKFDPTTPGAPSVTQNATSYTIGTAASFTIAHNSSGPTPTSYTWQLNGAAPRTVAADSSGNATFSVTPTRGTDALAVTAVSAGGNIGGTATVIFNAAAPANAADSDMTGDQVPDIVTPGGTGTGLAPGLWLYPGQAGPSLTSGDGQVVTSGVNIGIEGNGIATDYKPTDFNGAQVITGLFTSNGLQDALAYYPSGTYAGEGAILDGNGDGSVLENQDAANTTAISSYAFTSTDPNGDIPLQIANGYNADPNDNPAYPDLITTSGDATNGYYLEYYQNAGTIGTYFNSVPLSSTASPDGTMDWNNWLITTMADPSAGRDMILYSKTTGALWLWQSFIVNDTTGTVSYTSYQLSSSWNPGSISELRAADITGSGPAVWAVTTSGSVSAWIVTGLPSAPSISQAASQTLLAPSHAWRLGDGTSGTATTAADTGSSTTIPLTGTGGVTWDTSDLFNPAVSFDGTTGYMTTASQAVNTTSSYTISAWVKPEALGGIILSQYGSQASCMRLSITSTDPATAAWRFAVTNSDSANATSTSVTAGSTYPVTLGAWTHLTAIYDATDQRITLYVNGIRTDSAGTSGVWSSGCNTFALSRWNSGGSLGGYFNGKIADVQAWNGNYLTPTQIADLSGTPGYVLFPADSHQYPTGSQWTTAHGQMTFSQGQLTIKETGTGTATATFGKTGYPGAVLTPQTDGNLVSYPTAADATGQANAIWASGTASNPGDVMFFQPDGNLVIYNNYGAVLWSSGTAN